MTETLPVWVAIAVAVIGSGASGTLVAWVLNRVDRKDRLLTRDDLDHALEDSPVIKEILGKLDNDYHRFNQLELTLLRQDLFSHTRSRTQHERQLEAGKEYIAKGGNGLGHVRYDWLSKDYEQRLADEDWDYTTTHHTHNE